MVKFNLFSAIDLVDRQDFRSLQRLFGDPEWLREFQNTLSYILPKIITTDVDDRKLALRIAALERVEPFIALNRDHPDLVTQLMLLHLGGFGKTRHTFNRKDADVGRLLEFIRIFTPDAREEEITIWCSTQDQDSINNLTMRAGLQRKDADAIVKSWKACRAKS